MDKEGESLAPCGIFAEIAGLQQEDRGVSVSLLCKQQKNTMTLIIKEGHGDPLVLFSDTTPQLYGESEISRSEVCRSNVSGKPRTSSAGCGNAEEQV